MPHATTHKLLQASLLLLAASCAFPADPIRLATHQQPPLSFTRDNGQADGLAVRIVDCALKKLQRPYTLDFLPWPRAQWLVQRQQFDGFFAATPSEERDGYAVLSGALLPYERRWYLLKSSPLSPSSPEFKRLARIAAFNGSNMDVWLRDHGYQLTSTPGNSEQLLRMLQSRRVDAVLGNAYAVDALIARLGLQAELRSELAEALPMGVYFGKAFLSREDPQFLTQFNNALQGCRSK
ncbi:transporter substrate-binding domain-containing protein [Chromobacterium violaceum]|uniref:substrate-binding periplasmic protein n=1 Tax=Chromobacterium violaceum TaxID=536 RepID=UPI001BE86C4C|nr:transporter substrate-binding domain-containing protein [Chromobacterium violaceum]MBT2869094.1 transporter substrate-binding domain-containing protein [Chromobacterium violaceum]